MDNKQCEKIFEESIQVCKNTLNQENIVCPFCGQVLLNGALCTCDAAVREHDIQEKINEATESTLHTLIDEESCEKFGFEPIVNEELIDALSNVIDNVGHHLFSKVTMKVDDETQFIIQNKPGYIEIQRKENTSKVIKLGG